MCTHPSFLPSCFWLRLINTRQTSIQLWARLSSCWRRSWYLSPPRCWRYGCYEKARLEMRFYICSVHLQEVSRLTRCSSCILVLNGLSSFFLMLPANKCDLIVLHFIFILLTSLRCITFTSTVKMYKFNNCIEMCTFCFLLNVK